MDIEERDRALRDAQPAPLQRIGACLKTSFHNDSQVVDGEIERLLGLLSQDQLKPA